MRTGVLPQRGRTEGDDLLAGDIFQDRLSGLQVLQLLVVTHCIKGHIVSMGKSMAGNLMTLGLDHLDDVRAIFRKVGDIEERGLDPEFVVKVHSRLTVQTACAVLSTFVFFTSPSLTIYEKWMENVSPGASFSPVVTVRLPSSSSSASESRKGV